MTFKKLASITVLCATLQNNICAFSETELAAIAIVGSGAVCGLIGLYAGKNLTNSPATIKALQTADEATFAREQALELQTKQNQEKEAVAKARNTLNAVMLKYQQEPNNEYVAEHLLNNIIIEKHGNVLNPHQMYANQLNTDIQMLNESITLSIQEKLDQYERDTYNLVRNKLLKIRAKTNATFSGQIARQAEIIEQHQFEHAKRQQELENLKLEGKILAQQQENEVKQALALIQVIPTLQAIKNTQQEMKNTQNDNHALVIQVVNRVGGDITKIDANVTRLDAGIKGVSETARTNQRSLLNLLHQIYNHLTQPASVEEIRPPATNPNAQSPQG